MRAGNPLDRGIQVSQQIEHGPVSFGSGIESGEIDSHLFQMFLDQVIVLRFIPGLSGKRELDFGFRSRCDPNRRQLTGFQFISERHF